jgi:GT2 family glycosyltransferase
MIDVLIPTCNRLASLVMSLTGLALQEFSDLHIVIADQSQSPVDEYPEIQALFRLMDARGGSIEYHRRQVDHGVAEQRDFLLGRAQSDYVLFLDDDVLMEPWVTKKLVKIIQSEKCGFVGAFPAGLSFLQDIRPEQQHIEYWDGPVQPEVVEPGSPEWERWNIHRAANLYHIGQSLPPKTTRLYKVAWLGACVLYDREKLLEIGGYSFWSRLPRYHSGEDVLVQNLLMRRWGGCGIVPSGTHFSEAPTTVLNSVGKVEGHALDLLPEMIDRCASESVQPDKAAR